MALREEVISKLGQMGVPVMDIDTEVLIGYSQREPKEKLRLS